MDKKAKKKTPKHKPRIRPKIPKSMTGVVGCDEGRQQPERMEVFDAFVTWTALPVPLREVKTQEEFAKRYGVNPWTLCDWRSRKDFWTMVRKRTETWGRSQTPQVIAKLFSQIMKADTINTEAYKLWLELYNGYSAKLTIDGHITPHAANPMDDITDEQLAEVIAKRDKVAKTIPVLEGK